MQLRSKQFNVSWNTFNPIGAGCYLIGGKQFCLGCRRWKLWKTNWQTAATWRHHSGLTWNDWKKGETSRALWFSGDHVASECLVNPVMFNHIWWEIVTHVIIHVVCWNRCACAMREPSFETLTQWRNVLNKSGNVTIVSRSWNLWHQNTSHILVDLTRQCTCSCGQCERKNSFRSHPGSVHKFNSKNVLRRKKIEVCPNLLVSRCNALSLNVFCKTNPDLDWVHLPKRKQHWSKTLFVAENHLTM